MSKLKCREFGGLMGDSFVISRLENGEMKKHVFNSFDELEEWIEWQLKGYRLTNCVRDEKKDRSYLEYKNMMDIYLEKGRERLDDYKACLICEPEEHEGYFCRCEMRNIRVAKEMRKRGESNWNQKNLNDNQKLNTTETTVNSA